MQLKENLTRHIGGIRACKSDSFEQLVVVVLLPSLSARLWSEDTTECSDPPPLTDFIKFLDQCLQAVEIVTETRLPDSTLAHKKSRQQVSRSGFHNDHSQDRARALHTRNAEGCPYCNGHHSLYFCQAFKNLNVDKRNNVLSRNKLCDNCLSRGHSLEECSSTHTCRECEKKHHTLLHRFSAGTGRASNVAASATAASPLPNTVTPTAATQPQASVPNMQSPASTPSDQPLVSTPNAQPPMSTSRYFYQPSQPISLILLSSYLLLH